MKILLSGLLLFFPLLASAANTMSIEVDPRSKQFQVPLSANPTTGFQWTVKKFDKQLLRLKKSEFIASKTKRIGAGGKMIFTFELLEVKSYPESTDILFQYARPWEKKDGSLQQVRVLFQQKKTG